MKKIVRLTERDLTRIVKRVIKESNLQGFTDDEMEDEINRERMSDIWRMEFYDALNFDHLSAFPEFNKESDIFDDNLNNFIVDMMDEDPKHAARMLRKEPWFRPYKKYLR
jgi:hypothetical protein